MTRAAKDRDRSLLRIETRGAADVVEVQVAEDDRIDVVGLDTQRRQTRNQRLAFFHLIEPAIERGKLAAVAGIDQHRMFAVARQHAVVRTLDAIEFVGRGHIFPDRARDDAEHHAAVEPEQAAVDRIELPVAEEHGEAYE